MRKVNCVEDELRKATLRIIKALLKLKYLVFLVFSRTSSISILLYAPSLLIGSKIFADRFLFCQRSTRCCAIFIFYGINISACDIVHDPFFFLIFQFFLYLNLPAF